MSGDSRNCGDVVMPGIAAGVLRDRADFYWHLGDFRRIEGVDEDIQNQPEHLGKPMAMADYESMAWPDFIEHQLTPFGSLPLFLSIGNHETIAPKNRAQVLEQFADWFNSPAVVRQRLLDDPRDHLMKGYYRWIEHGVSFYSLDNSTADQFDAAQLKWFEGTLAKDAADPTILTIVVGMHEGLPDGLTSNHAMDQFSVGVLSGRRVYADLLQFQSQTHKYVYTLASHSHFFMEGVFNSEYLRAHGGVLPGWIVGTAGAVRYALPPESKDAKAAETNVYGYMVGSVAPSGEISFEFKRLDEKDVPAEVVSRYKRDFVHWCFAENTEAK